MRERSGRATACPAGVEGRKPRPPRAPALRTRNGRRRHAAWAALLLGALLAGCSEPAPEDRSPTHPWLPGDTWTYDLRTPHADLVDVWTVVGPATLNGTSVLQVSSITRGPGVDTSEVGSFDADTLVLRRVDGEEVTLDFNPADVWLVPPQNRTYEAQITESRGNETRTVRASYAVDLEGEETVETGAGALAAYRFAVRKTTFTDDGPSEERSTYWWSPIAFNVVRQDTEEATVRMLTSYDLVEGPRTVPGALD